MKGDPDLRPQTSDLLTHKSFVFLERIFRLMENAS